MSIERFPHDSYNRPALVNVKTNLKDATSSFKSLCLSARLARGNVSNSSKRDRQRCTACVKTNVFWFYHEGTH